MIEYDPNLLIYRLRTEIQKMERKEQIGLQKLDDKNPVSQRDPESTCKIFNFADERSEISPKMEQISFPKPINGVKEFPGPQTKIAPPKTTKIRKENKLQEQRAQAKEKKYEQ